MTTVQQLINMLSQENPDAPVTGKIRIKQDKGFLTVTIYKGRRP